MNNSFKFNKLKKIIDKHDVISFDIFDTLIKRNCLVPTDIFKIVQIKYNNESENKINSFCEQRISAERNARVNSEFQDINLDEIYKQLNYESKIKQRLKEIEVETELEFCQKNLEMYDIYQYCKFKKKRIVCTSNMYLDNKTIKKILLNCGYNIPEIFVSSEYRFTKQSGMLFKKVINELKISKKKILHIGDSYKPDIIGALKVGIDCYHINEKIDTKYINYEKCKNNINLSTNIILSLIKNNTLKLQNSYEKFGYEILGPIILKMNFWIQNISLKKNINNILFCSRDTKLLYEAYNKLFNKNDLIKNNYFYVSRKSTYLPYLYLNQSFENFINLFSKNRKYASITDLIGMLNIKIIDKSTIEKYDLSPTEEYELKKLFKNINFKKYYEDVILDYVNSVGKKQYNNFINYLNSLKIDKNTAIVDIGWRGTTQKLLINILNYNLYGFYFGLKDKHQELNNNYFTFLFDENNNSYCDTLSPIFELLELIFSALHGSTIGYCDNDDRYYILEKSANEKNEYISKIQNGALNFIDDIVKYKYILNDFNDKLFINSLLNICFNPSLEQAQILGDLYSENYNVHFIARPKSLLYYFFHLNELKKDIKSSSWKVGFLKRLFKINLPYYKIYLNMKKIMK